jgi:membrane protein implicated in regulation of membrane protease activity
MADAPILALKKLGGLFLLVIGLLLLAAGIVNETTGLTLFGGLVFIAGAILLVLKIARRNQPT